MKGKRLKKKITIVTRESPLAMWQAEFVANALKAHYSSLEIHIQGITTEGDRKLDVTLSKIGGKGLFVKELEQHLYDKHADLAVHSLKDVPQVLPEGLCLAAILKREDPRDALITHSGESLMDLPPGSVIGSSSLRRQAQLLKCRPDIQIQPLRGNVGTRLSKLKAGDYDGIVLAAAGLKRLGLSDKINEYLSPKVLIPAVGQGALAIECRSHDEELKQMLQVLNDKVTHACVSAERAMNLCLDGSCQAPIAGFAEIDHQTLRLVGLVAEPDASKILRAESHGKIKDAEKIGQAVGEFLLAQGASQIIARLKQGQMDA